MSFLGVLVALGAASTIGFIAYWYMQNAESIQKNLNPEPTPEPVPEPVPEPTPVVEETIPEQTRNPLGQFVADDPSTPDVNEAWVGGVAPKPKTARKPKAKKPAEATTAEPKKKTQRKPKVKVVK